MNNDTLRKQKRREKLVKSFSEDWEIDTSIEPTIRYKKVAGIHGLWKKYFGKKHSVFAMYWFFKHDRLNNHESRKFYFPIEHDNMPVSGVPMKYEMQGTWQIDEGDLKYLYGGPLIDQDGDLLVPVDTKIKKLQRFIQLAAPFLVFTSAAIGIIIKLPQLLELIG